MTFEELFLCATDFDMDSILTPEQALFITLDELSTLRAENRMLKEQLNEKN